MPVDLLNGVRPNQRGSRNRQRLHRADRGEAKAQAAATLAGGRCRNNPKVSDPMPLPPFAQTGINAPATNATAS